MIYNLNSFFVILKYTYLEFAKSKIYLISIGLGLILFILSFVAKEFTYGAPEKIVLDVGLGLLSLTANTLAIFLGVNLIRKEFEWKTLYLVLSKPVSRFNYVIARLVGLLVSIVSICLILSFFIFLASMIFGKGLNNVFFWNLLFISLEASILLLIVTLFSFISNPVITVFISLIVLVAGHALKNIHEITFVKNSKFLEVFFEIYSKIMPNFSKLNFKAFVYYQESIDSGLIINAFSYSLFYIIFLIGIISVIFHKKELV